MLSTSHQPDGHGTLRALIPDRPPGRHQLAPARDDSAIADEIAALDLVRQAEASQVGSGTVERLELAVDDLATTLIDLHRDHASAAHLRTAAQLARETGHAEIAAWCLETQAWQVLTAGDLALGPALSGNSGDDKTRLRHCPNLAARKPSARTDRLGVPMTRVMRVAGP